MYYYYYTCSFSDLSGETTFVMVLLTIYVSSRKVKHNNYNN